MSTSQREKRASLVSIETPVIGLSVMSRTAIAQRELHMAWIFGLFIPEESEAVRK